MQIRDGSSRYPSDLIEKFTIQEDAARKYVPAEDKTIVLNFAEYWKKSAEWKGSKRFSPFKNSLDEQFKLMSYDLTGTRSLITFIWSSLYKLKKKTQRQLYFSHPSFYKTSADEDEVRPVNLDNVAIRIPLNRFDLVLMGDIRTMEDKKITRVEYVVKGISILEKSTHYGEYKVDTAVVARVLNYAPGTDAWMPGFYTTKGDLADGVPRDIYEKTILRNDLVAELNERYIVKNPVAAIKQLNEWSDLLTSEMNEAEVNEIMGFNIERPEFMVAFPLPLGTPISPESIIFETESEVWTDEIRTDSTAHPIVRITHNINQKAFERDSRYVDKFNKLTACDVRIVDAASSLTGDMSKMDKAEYDRFVKLSHIGKNRLCPPMLKGALSDESVSLLRKEMDEELAAIEENYRNRIAEKLTRVTEEYLSREEISAALDQYLEDSAEAISVAAEEERKDRADTLYGEAMSAVDDLMAQLQERASEDLFEMDEESARKTLEGDPETLALYEDYLGRLKAGRYTEILENIPLDECTEAARNRLRAEKSEEICSEYIYTVRQELEKQFAPERTSRENRARENYGKALEELVKESGESTLTTYYELEIGIRDSVMDEINQRAGKFTGKQYRLTIDQMGSEASITRLMDAIESFKNGEVSNPYLASYLYSTEDAKIGVLPSIYHFYRNELNELQKDAVRKAVNSDGLYLIQGPPGTGKTQVIAEIAFQKILDGRKVLITSQNNKAIDNAFDRLYENALVRPIRMMAVNKNNKYEFDCIVSNFYNNVSKSLEKQMDLYEDVGNKERVLKKFESLKETYEDYCDLRDDLEDDLLDIEDDEIDLLSLTQKIEDEKRKLVEKTAKIDLVKDLIAGLYTFELTSYNECAAEIKDLFRPFMNLSMPDQGRMTESEIEGKLFGRYGYCCGLMDLDEERFQQQIDLMTQHREYIDLNYRLCRCQNDSDRASVSERIDAYIESNEIQVEDFVLLQMFGADLPNNIADIRDRLSRFREKLLRKYEARLAKLYRSETGEDKIEDLKKTIDEITEELEDLRGSKDYKEYAALAQALMGDIQDMFSDLHISEKIGNVEDAFASIERKVGILKGMNADDIALSKRIFGEVTDYLRKDNIDAIDHDRIMSELRNYINVVGITCTASGQTLADIDGEEGKQKIKLDATTMGIDVVIIDEVSKVPFSELIRPILWGKSVIMVGDHKQLPPMYTVKYDSETVDARSKVAERENRFKEMYETSLFQELWNQAPDRSKTMLRTQYRMASQIMNAINRFYDDEGGLEMGCLDENRAHRITIEGNGMNILSPEKSILFINCKGTGTQAKGSTSFRNELEADVVTKTVELLERNCASDRNGRSLEFAQESDKLSMGVISPYADQVRLIIKDTEKIARRIKSFCMQGEESFSIKSVDDFQGDERDIIILSLVRSSKSKFISDFRRINVAMSRARRLLVIVGNAEALETQSVKIDGTDKPVYKEIIDEIKAKGCYLEAENILEVE